MDIHRTGKVADWYAVPEAERNRWQKIASATHGYLTPGNLVSIAGAIVTILGFVWVYQGQYSSGFVAIAAGRFCDILDGFVAHYTGTKSSLGEAVDAGLDKVVVLAAFITFILAGIAPLILMIALGVQQLIAAALGGYARVQHLGLHPSRLGKITMAAQWVVLLSYIVAAISTDTPDLIMWLLHIVLAATIIAGFVTTSGYVRHILRAKRRAA